MLCVAYISSARPDLTVQDMVRIATTSTRNNSKAQITGVLTYHDGLFMQIVEGEDKMVEALLKRVHKDPRHHSLREIFRLPITERHFATWGTALACVDDLPTHERDTFQQLSRSLPDQLLSDELKPRITRMVNAFISMAGGTVP